MFKCIAFDLGRVIFDFDFHIALNKNKDRIGAPASEVIEALFNHNFALDYEKGLISSWQFFQRFKKSFSAHLDYEEFRCLWSEIFTPKDDVISLVRKLKNICPIYLITNICELHFEYLYKKYPDIFALFCDLIISYKIGSVKPEKEIYENLRRLTGVRFEDIVYIDDRQDLIIEAKKLKLRCIKFNNCNQLIDDLASLGARFPENSNPNC